MPDREGVLEVPHGDDEAEELPEGHHQGDGQRRALRGQDEHAADAHVSEGRESGDTLWGSTGTVEGLFESYRFDIT